MIFQPLCLLLLVVLCMTNEIFFWHGTFAELLDHSHFFLKDFNGSLMSCSFVSHTIAMAPRAKKRRNLPHLHHHKDLKEQMKIGSWNQKPHKETLLWFLLLWCPWKMLFCVNGIFPPLSEDDTFFKLLKMSVKNWNIGFLARKFKLFESKHLSKRLKY